MTARMKQCELSSLNNQRILFLSWIPEQYAHEGKILRIKIDHTPNVVKVTRVYQTAMSVEYVADHERDFLHQREASDI